MAVKAKYDRYKTQQRREKNKVNKLTKYLLRNPNDQQTAKRLDEIREKLK